nr:MAG TPA: hypothetical protein [Caudoviricetes sp.]
MNEILKTITAYRKQLADIEKRIDNVRNVREYDKLVAERQIALYDMQSSVDELNRTIGIEIQCNADIMSNDAANIIEREMINRATK